MNTFSDNKNEEQNEACPQCGTKISKNDALCPTCATILKEETASKNTKPSCYNKNGLIESPCSGENEKRKGYRYVLALFTCAIIWYFYIVFSISVAWKHMGGIIPLMLMFIASGAIWRGITRTKRIRTPIETARVIMEMEQRYCIGPGCYRNESLTSEQAYEQASYIFKTTDMTHCALLIPSEKVFIVYKNDSFNSPSKVSSITIDEYDVENIRKFFTQQKFIA